jgi:alkylhydroperoxidase/carboxymuconolactone decarboxylase family protein YurZ
MQRIPEPPHTYKEFVGRYPKLGQAWGLIAEAGAEGPLDEKTVRLVKLAIALGAMREGAVHSSVRKAQALGIPREQMEQVVALAAGTLGLPATVAVYTWVRDALQAEG